jgi:hypothetical protein
MEMTFRVLINLSHENQFWTEILLQQELLLPLIMRTIMKSHSQRSFVKKEEEVEADNTTLPSEDDEDAQALDRLCLAFGLLTNLIQVSSKAKSLIRETRNYSFFYHVHHYLTCVRYRFVLSFQTYMHTNMPVPEPRQRPSMPRTRVRTAQSFISTRS